MAHNSDQIPGIAASIWEGAPEEVYHNMWYDDLAFMESSENYAQAQSLLMEPQPEADFMDVEDIEEADPDALEKAAYQSTINDQQIMDLMGQGFSIEDAVAMSPGTSGVMTPYGPGLLDDEVATIMDEYPGLDAYKDMSINDWEDIDFFGSMIEEAAGTKIDTVMENVEEIATDEGQLDNIKDFFNAAGSSIGNAIVDTPGFIAQSIWDTFGGVGERQLGQMELGQEIGQDIQAGITAGVDKIVADTDGVVYADTGVSPGLDEAQQELMNGLEAMGVGGMAQYLGDPSNYQSGEIIAEDVEAFLNALTAMGEDADIIEMLRNGFRYRNVDLSILAQAEQANEREAILTTADNVAETQIADEAEEVAFAEQAQQDLIRQADEAAVAEAAARDDDQKAAAVLGGPGGPPDLPWLADTTGPPVPEEALEELKGVNFDTEFWKVFNELPGSGSSDAQTTLGPRLAEEAELLWYLKGDYPESDTVKRDKAFEKFHMENMNEYYERELNPVQYVGYDLETSLDSEEAALENTAYGDHVLDFFGDPDEERYGESFYDNVEDLKTRMAKYEGKAMSTILKDWNALYYKDDETKHQVTSDIYSRQLFIEGTGAADRLSTLVAMYNTPKGSDAWFRNEQKRVYKNLYNSWLMADKSPESFLNTFVSGNRGADIEAGQAGGA